MTVIGAFGDTLLSISLCIQLTLTVISGSCWGWKGFPLKAPASLHSVDLRERSAGESTPVQLLEVWRRCQTTEGRDKAELDFELNMIISQKLDVTY